MEERRQDRSPDLERYGRRRTLRGRAGFAACLLGALVGVASGGEPPLAAPKAPPDFFDQIKQANVGGAVFIFGVEERLRMERWNNEDLNDKVNDRDTRWFNRLRLSMDTIFNSWLRTRVDLVDGREWESDREPRSQNDELDLHQAYVQFGDKPLMVRLGRQELDFGSRKLVAAPTWNNLLRSFDAGRVSYASDLLDVSAFCGSVVTPVDDQFNEHRHGERFSGIFATLKPVRDHKLDLYALRLHTWNDEFFVTGENKEKGPTDRYTYGARLYGDILPKRWTYDVEAAIQRGHYADDRIRAWAFHADTAYTFLDLPWQPTIQPVFNFASGDKNPKDGINGTFDPLYTSTHGMYGGIMDLVTWKNIEVAGLRLRAKPVPKLLVAAEVHRYWLAEDKDAWYLGTKKSFRRDKTGKSGDNVGTEVGGWARYTVSKHLEFEGGIAHFFPGRFAEKTGPHDDMSFCYLMTTLRY